jgi:RHS repeat-associated protein
MPVTNYIWDELSDNVLMETDGNDNVTAEYDHEPGQFGELISQTRDGVNSYYHYDGAGNTVALTDDNGNVTDTYKYSAFGKLIASTVTTINPYRFNGQVGYQYNEETDDYYVRARTYEPTIARWLSRGLFGYVGGLSLYAFLFQNPRIPEIGGGGGVEKPPTPTPRGTKCFDVKKDKEWWVATAPWIARGTKLLTAGLQFAFAGMPLALGDVVFSEIKNHVELMKELVRHMEELEIESNSHNKLRALARRAAGERLTRESLSQFLGVIAPRNYRDGNWGSLSRVRMSDDKYRWLCPEHAASAR